MGIESVEKGSLKEYYEIFSSSHLNRLFGINSRRFTIWQHLAVNRLLVNRLTFCADLCIETTGEYNTQQGDQTKPLSFFKLTLHHVTWHVLNNHSMLKMFAH